MNRTLLFQTANDNIPEQCEKLFKRQEGFTYHHVQINYLKGCKFGLGIKHFQNNVLVSRIDPGRVFYKSHLPAGKTSVSGDRKKIWCLQKAVLFSVAQYYWQTKLFFAKRTYYIFRLVKGFAVKIVLDSLLFIIKWGVGEPSAINWSSLMELHDFWSKRCTFKARWQRNRFKRTIISLISKEPKCPIKKLQGTYLFALLRLRFIPGTTAIMKLQNINAQHLR